MTLRTGSILLFVVTVILTLSLILAFRNTHRRRANAARMSLETNGATFFGDDTENLAFTHVDLDDHALDSLADLEHEPFVLQFHSVSLSKRSLAPASKSSITAIAFFQCDLEQSHIDDIGTLEALTNVTIIHSLTRGCSLSPLASLQRLRSIHLSGPAIDDAALGTLSQSPSLVHVIITDASTTVNALETLAEISTLKVLNLGNIKLNANEKTRLKKAFPNCQVTIR